jgi:hypothetical protein
MLFGGVMGQPQPGADRRLVVVSLVLMMMLDRSESGHASVIGWFGRLLK